MDALDDWDDEESELIAEARAKRRVAREFLLFSLLGFVLVILGVVMSVSLAISSSMISFLSISIVTVTLGMCYSIGVSNYVESKGYHRIVGAVSFILPSLGLLILVFLRDEIRPR